MTRRIIRRIKTAIFICGFFAAFFAHPVEIFSPQIYDGKTALSGFVMSEKLDGVRGIWDGKTLKTRNGKILNPPPWFIENYPPFAIDGELWTQRGDFANIVSIVHKKTPDARWQNITHQIFEVPEAAGGLHERLTVLAQFLAQNPESPIRIIPQITIENSADAAAFLKKIQALGGEGIIVRNPQKPYQSGRLDSAFKIKPYWDAECRVREILAGTGRNARRMGSLRCETADGKNFKIGSGFSDAERKNPPPVGSLITFKYYGLTKNGKPRFPVFLRIRQEE